MSNEELLILPSMQRGEMNPVSMQDSFAALIGYAFSTRDVRLEDGSLVQVHRYGYHSYDCVPATQGKGMSDIDLLVVNGLNARLGVKELENLRDAAERAAVYGHQAAERGKSFWELDDRELSDAPPAGTVGEQLGQAWRACTVTPYVDVARTHKLLHHKWPHLFPLIDRKTRIPLRAARQAGETLWQVILRELRDNGPCFNELEDQFASVAHRRGDVALTRLRIHDILLWLQVNDWLDDATRAGVVLLRDEGP